MWEENLECTLYFPERQQQNHLTTTNPTPVCGNGFQVYMQTECVMGNFSLQPQNLEWCPPNGFHVKSCYKTCSSNILYQLASQYRMPLARHIAIKTSLSCQCSVTRYIRVGQQPAHRFSAVNISITRIVIKLARVSVTLHFYKLS